MSVKYTGLDRLTQIFNLMKNKFAPIPHDSTATTYGSSTTSKYGHVKLVTGDMNGASHSDGVAVSKNHTHSQYLTTHQDISGKVNKSGDTMTGALTLANGTRNPIGDDVGIGDCNRAGTLGIQGLNGSTKLALLQYNTTWNQSSAAATLEFDGTNLNVDKTIKMGGNTVATTSQIPTKTSQLTNDSGFLTSHQDISGKVNKSGDTMTGDLTLQTGTNDSPDIVWKYANGQEKMRLWSQDTYTAADGINYRVYNTSGGLLYSGTLATKAQIPTVNNGTLTIQKNGTSVATFSANQSGNATANITVPTKTSELTNDSGFLTSSHTHSFTPSGSVSSSFTGSAVTSGVNSGNAVAALTNPTYDANTKKLTFATSNVAPNGHTHSVTAAGSVSSSFTGTAGRTGSANT